MAQPILGQGTLFHTLQQIKGYATILSASGCTRLVAYIRLIGQWVVKFRHFCTRSLYLPFFSTNSPLFMTKGAHKQHPVKGIAAAPSKKQRIADSSSIHRSSRVGKGSGGATEQLKKVGEAVASSHQKKPDAFFAAGKECNPMAPKSQKRTNQVSVHICVHPQPSTLTLSIQGDHQPPPQRAAAQDSQRSTNRVSDMSCI